MIRKRNLWFLNIKTIVRYLFIMIMKTLFWLANGSFCLTVYNYCYFNQETKFNYINYKSINFNLLLN